MKYKLFISDFDMTMGRAPDIIQPETVNAVKEFQKQGGKFVICTGRSYLSIKKVCQKYGIKGDVIAFQGSLACNLETDKELFNGAVNNEYASLAVKDLLELGVETGVYLDDLYYYDKKGEYIAHYEKLVMVDGVLVDNLVDYTLNTNKKIRKILSLGEGKYLDQILEKLTPKHEGKLIFNKSSESILEVICPDWSKKEAVKRIAKYYDIPLSSVIAVGDSTNDLPLLDGEWHGVAVGDAMKELKDFAKEITVNFEEQPVKFLLEKYCL